MLPETPSKLMALVARDEAEALDREPICQCERAVGIEQDWGSDLSILRCTSCAGIIPWPRLYAGTAMQRPAVLQ